MKNLEARYQNAIKKIGHKRLLDLPQQVKDILKKTNDLKSKVELLEEIAKTL